MEILSEKTGPLGGIKGDAFDDGVFDGVKKVTVGKDKHCLGYIKIEYEKDGKFETRVHGTMETILGELKEFSVKPNEYITAVGGSYNHIFNYDSVFITSLYFTTSTGRTSPKFGETNGDEFLLEGKNGGKLLGFHGRSGQLLDAIGPHFDTGVVKLGQQGGTGGNAWDHGVYIGVRKVVVTYNPPGISHIIVDYDKAGKVEMRQEGNLKGENQVPGKQYEFVLDYPNEYITSIEGSCDLVPGLTNRVRSVSFSTSTERTSPTYGGVCEKTFVLESKGKALVGFHGRAGLAIDAIGAYFGPLPVVSVVKLGQQGGTGGNTWDHGVYTGVRKVVVTYNPPGISHIIVHYDKAGKVEMRQEGNLKGENQVPGKQYEFVLDYPNEYITSIEGSCDLVPGLTNRVRSLSFKTSTKRTSPTYGGVCEKTFVLESKGKALVGLHGRAGLAIDALGAYFGPLPVVPPAENKLQG